MKFSIFSSEKNKLYIAWASFHNDYIFRRGSIVVAIKLDFSSTTVQIGAQVGCITVVQKYEPPHGKTNNVVSDQV